MKLYVASAGTGKTHTLVEELLALVKEGVPLRRIAAVTFTRKAAEELRARARKGVEALAREEPGFSGAVREVHGAVFGTIHGFMAEALRHAAPFLSLDPDFAVVDELLAEALFLEEARSLLYLLGEDPGLEALLRRLYQGRTLAEAFRPLEGAEGLVRLFMEVLARYRRRAQEVLGPGDLEALALRLLRHPKALARVVERFPYVLVDEYQDTSPLQGRFFQALEEAGARVVAVGDPKQSIYLFRNARLEVFREALGRAEEVLVLDKTRRHARRVAAFLNRFVALFPEGERVAVRPTREAEGRVEVHWVEGGAGLEERRRFEADLLARRLLALKAEGYAFGEMAVLVRSRASLSLLEWAFRARGVPYVLRRGQSFFNRLEVRDLYHALRLALLEGPPGPEERRSLLAFLRSPFVGLNLGEVEEALLREDPLPHLPQAVRDRVAWLKGLAGKRPLEALKALVRDEVFLSRLSPRARANLDALLLLAGLERFPDLEALLEWLRLRALDPEASELPEGGEGVSLLTVHAAKGLEWPVVAVYDVARGEPGPASSVLVGPEGEVAVAGTRAYRDLAQRLAQAQREEAVRLLYVALSRARDVLLVTGSRSGRESPWVQALERLGLGPESQDPLVARHPVPQGWRPPRSAPAARREGPPASYAEHLLPPRPLPLVHSPSAHLKAEPKPLAEALEGEAVSGFARALGTLVHYALARDLDPEDERAMRALLHQEVAFPFAEGEKERLLAEVRALLRRYRGMLGRELPALEERAEDYRELPLVLPLKGTVWHGVLDRVYRVGDRWYLDDYKTDREVRPEAYRLQLALYRQALLEAWGVRAEARLVYLRAGRVHAFGEAELEEALAALPS
ncbi:UvrD-helicase domain-containing protein [Thermus thermophilus]|uniref:UvrD-helicase domain-containing protein n=1 Tax=Thermus thermophilus TaxID=274 RepID=UPI001CC7F25B|nr:UvrD-helicase domain-containing protein [Thermus thermophilus]BDB11460.1 ATP-dependent DNA helicase [Thermus thermophilus]